MSDTSERTHSPRDWRATLFLPTTDFSMKAGLAEAEPKWLAQWDETDLYGRIRKAAKGRPLFVLHDGPPYANGEIHSGTGLNKILKDFVVRSQGMLGKDAPYVPGWDCHGLPIEWKIEEKYRALGKSKDDVPVAQLRADCRAFAEKWIDVQRGQFKRLGCIGEWGRPYTTMDFRAEAAIASEFFKFVDNGLLYKGFRPVMWSPVEKTALAEAEVEYLDKTSPSIYVKFPLIRRGALAEGTSVVIWTTTPWTIPGNRAIAFSPTIAYGLYRVSEAREGASTKVGEHLLLADILAADVAEKAKVKLTRVDDAAPNGLVAAHPLRGRGYDFDVPLLEGTHVTADAGTGFVHTAPGHGEDDFEIGRRHGLEVPETVDEESVFFGHVPIFAGSRVIKQDGKDGDANGAVIRELAGAGALFAKASVKHSYPHSWRSKAPVIFRATPQWFASMDKPFKHSGGKTLRELALAAIGATKWYPRQGGNRLAGMVRDRPDWVLSRQRVWGVPLAVFVEKKSGEVLNDAAVNARVTEAFRSEGADAWFNSPPQRFLGNDRNPEDYEQVKDILDVWFDSGSTHVFTLENPIEPSWPKKANADLYLEGSDQHRGWFQSSLLETCGTRGRAPFDAVLTHGFVLDREGDKMSKSAGNTILPQVIAEKHGADILRLWVASSDFTEDLRMANDIIQANVDAYRRLRNTIRFMLMNLNDFGEKERVLPDHMPELERYILANLASLDGSLRGFYGEYDFNRVFQTLFSFCTNELSAFHFDIRRDVLYCDPVSSPRRRAARTVIDACFSRVVTWFAPILCFTMEEAWASRHGSGAESVHLQLFRETPRGWEDEKLLEKWSRIRTLRRVVTGALEVKRRDKVIGSSLEARPILFVGEEDAKLFADIDLAEIAITSGARVSTNAPAEDAYSLPDVPGVAVAFHHAEGDKCARCWMILPDVGANRKYPDLCRRCVGAVEAHAGRLS